MPPHPSLGISAARMAGECRSVPSSHGARCGGGYGREGQALFLEAMRAMEGICPVTICLGGYLPTPAAASGLDGGHAE